MFLEMNSFEVEDVIFHENTSYHGGTLNLGSNALKKYLLSHDGNAQDVTLSLARPGDRLRITNVVDVVEPMITSEGRYVFPGFLAPPVAMNPCFLNRLEGVSIVAVQEPVAQVPFMTRHQAIVDMSGTGARYTPFSKLHNVVLQVRLKPGLGASEADRTIRLFALETASYLARTTVNQKLGNRISYQLAPVSKRLPKILAIVQLGGNGVLNESFIYGHGVTGILPTYLHPNEFLYGAVVNGNNTYACQRNFTYLFQNNVLLKQLYGGHGTEHIFLGTVVTPGYNPSHSAKVLSANYAAKIAKVLDADGVILTADGGGNAHVDVMFTCRECEKLGIKTVVQLNEMAGTDGSDPGLVDFVPEADAMVSVGNREEMLTLEEMTTIGKPLERREGRIRIPVRDICGSTHEMGNWNLGGRGD